MNERIKQLLGQAYDEAVPETWTTLSSEQLDRIYEKFAELIVKECASVGVGAFERSRKHGLDDIIHAIRGDIVKHFGVEP
jgi:hypothetical protein